MKLVVVNPNATAALTDACVDIARAAASAGTEIVGWTNTAGPPVVDSFSTDYAAGHALVAGLRMLSPVPDAVVLCGFGNYGTAAVKEALGIPVVSMAEAAMSLALLLCHRFVIVTTAPRMIPYTEDLVQLGGFAARCAAVRAITLPPITAPPPDPAAVVADLEMAVAAVTADTGADLVILGGLRLSPYAAMLAAPTIVPILEPVACGVQITEALVRLRVRQSKVRKFAFP